MPITLKERIWDVVKDLRSDFGVEDIRYLLKEDLRAQAITGALRSLAREGKVRYEKPYLASSGRRYGARATYSKDLWFKPADWSRWPGTWWVVR